MPRAVCAVAAILLLLPLQTAATEISPLTPLHDARALTAAAPRIDGVLDDDAWQAALPFAAFTRRSPSPGEASQRTEVRFLTSPGALLVAARLFDDGEIWTAALRRDVRAHSDEFCVAVDVGHDHASARYFCVNPSNAQRDGVVYDDGSDDSGWDGAWRSAARRGPEGWNVELEIPFSTLAVTGGGEPLLWAFDATRLIARNSEEIRIAHVTPGEPGLVSRFAHLRLQPARARRDAVVVPYARSRLDDRSGNETAVGADVRYTTARNVNIVATINPDFGQVEVDPEKLELSGTELSQQEKRPFFVEHADFFRFANDAPNNWRINGAAVLPNVFYSRRIGRAPQALSRYRDLSEAPQETTIAGAVKTTGTFGQWSFGVLAARTIEETAAHDDERIVVEPATTYGAFRLKRARAAHAAGLFLGVVQRERSPETSFLRDRALVAGVDGHRKLRGGEVLLEGSAIATVVTGTPRAIAETQRSLVHNYQRPDAAHVEFDAARTRLSGWAGAVAVARQTGRWRYNVQTVAYSPGFEPNDLGFLQRADLIAGQGLLKYVDLTPGRFWREKTFIYEGFGRTNFGGDRLRGGHYAEISGTTLRGLSGALYTQYSPSFVDDRLTRGGPSLTRPGSWLFGAATAANERLRWKWRAEGRVRREVGTGATTLVGIGGVSTTFGRANLNARGTWTSGATSYEYVGIAAAAQNPPLYLFGRRREQRLDLQVGADYVPRPNLTASFYFQPFLVRAAHDDFSFLDDLAPRAFDDVEFDPSTNSYRWLGRSTSFANPDVAHRAVRTNFVVRWEYAPGMAVFLAWTDRRLDPAWREGSLASDLGDALAARGETASTLKITYARRF